jgi:hypothetical protein
LTVEKHDLEYQNSAHFEFKVTLDNTINNPTFNVEIIVSKQIYNYKISGLVYMQLKNFFGQTIYEWYKKQSKSSSGRQGAQKNTSDSYKKANETDEIKRKRKTYILLKDTLLGYNRQMNRIKEWKKANPSKTHPDEETTNNEIKTIKDKINLLNSKFHFESLYYLKHLRSILS